MKYLGIIVFLFLGSSVQTPLEQVRNQFPFIMSIEQADSFLEKLKNDNSPEAKGYTAAMILMKSRYLKSPFSKLKHFKKGKQILDTDIIENPKCLEIRYIRFLMQKQIPKFLGYHKNIEEDFNVLFNQLSSSTLEKGSKIKMLNKMLLVDNLSKTKRNKIYQILNKL